MATLRYQYGIDLGTTNSAIFALEDGVPKLIKIDGVDDIMPSCVSFTKKGLMRTGKAAYNTLRSERSRSTKLWKSDESNVFIEFKRNMGLNTAYHSSNTGKTYNPEDLSSYVLQALKSYVQNDNVTSAVITVPAKFKTDQIAATKRAADLAGIEHCELLQEPIAAAMAYGLSGKKDGYWLIFDFGGGTFDTALVKAEDGILQVKDTEGDNYLGGKNLDYGIVDEILIPHLSENFDLSEILSSNESKNILRDALKFYAEQAKNDLSFKPQTDIISQLDEFGEDDSGNELELDLVISAEDLKPIFTPIFQKAIDICRKLLERNNLTGADIDQLVLVGGPTYSPILREMIKKQLTENVNTSVNPMTAVAYGAALYASTLTYEDEVNAADIDDNTVILNVDYEANSVEPMEFVTCKISDENAADIEELAVEIKSSDNSWSSGRKSINRIGDLFECPLREHQANSFKISAYDRRGNPVKTIPDSLTIIQGTKVGSAVLPYNIGIEVHNVLEDRDVFITMKGLEKNQSLPASGMASGLKCPEIKKGSARDRLLIPIYQGEYNVDNSSAIFNDHVFDVEVKGTELKNSVPDNSDIKISIKVDTSQLMKVKVDFLSTGESIEKNVTVERRSVIDIGTLRNVYDKAENMLDSIQDANVCPAQQVEDLQSRLSDLDHRFDTEASSEDGKMHILADIRRLQLELEKIELDSRWEIYKQQFSEHIKFRMEMLDKPFLLKSMSMPKEEFVSRLKKLEEEGKRAIQNKDLRAYKQVNDREIMSLVTDAFPQLTLFSFIYHIRDNFNKLKWHDPVRARSILQRTMNNLDNLSISELAENARELISLEDISENQKARI